ncbi:MAG: ABC transporter permease [Ignavibacteriaceae bacterium]|nr:ABC transporter permease [Ignavibacteriaceae bacterium]
MLKSYFKIAFRNISRNKLYSTINIVGLAIGFTCTILILLWVQDELSYDRFNPNASNLYRVNWDFKWNGDEGRGPGTPPPLGTKLVSDIPEVNAATRLRPMLKTVVRYDDKYFNEDGIVSADSNFLELFPFQMLSGNGKSALKTPNSVVLTESIAHKYFGNESPVGKSIIIGDEEKNRYGVYQNLFKVTGVLKDLPHNSHIQFDMLTSISSYPEVAWRNWSWIWMQVTTYVQLKDGASSSVVQAKIPGFVKKYLPAGFKRLGMSFDDMIKSGGHWNFVLQPLTDVYLGSSSVGNRLGPIGNRTQVYLFSVIAIFILFIACINFMNLTTARSSSRAKEIGVRKVLGSARKALIMQFTVESLFFSFLALPISIILVEILIPLFNNISGKSLIFNIVNPFWLPAGLIAMGIIVGILSGSYPGLYLSSFIPVQVLKGASKALPKRRTLRNSLVVIQFAITIGVIVCTLLVKKQMDYVRQADLGFDEKGVIVISNENNRLGNQAQTYIDRLKTHSQIMDASISTGIPPSDTFEDYYKVEGKQERQFDLCSYLTDENFVNTMGLRLVKGRGFEKGHADSTTIILNEAAVKYLGLSDPIGKTITYNSNNVEYKVIGIVKDFNFLTLYSPITPFALFHKSSKSYSIPNSYIVVKVRHDELKSAIAAIESEWKSIAKAMPFEYTFLDQSFQAHYQSAERLGNIFFTFSFLTIFIACIGLFALAAFATEQRFKEIGIRKVLGASVLEIVVLLSKEFTWLVLISNIIAWPVAYYIINKWLQEFAYHIDISIWSFAVSGIAAVLIAFATVAYQAIRAANANPIKSLKYE